MIPENPCDHPVEVIVLGAAGRNRPVFALRCSGRISAACRSKPGMCTRRFSGATFPPHKARFWPLYDAANSEGGKCAKWAKYAPAFPAWAP